jgi:galactokinase
VHADKAGSVRDDYNRASLATRALLQCWNEAAPVPARSLGAAICEEGAANKLHELIGARTPAGYTQAALVARLSHFVAEDGRVPLAARAFASADATALRDLSHDSQRDADEWLGNQTPETRALAAAAFDAGAMAASSFGAGFGGSVWALVASGDAQPFAAAWLSDYARRCPGASNVEWFVARPGPPLTEVPAGAS